VDASLKAIIQKINRKHGDGTIVLGSEIPRPFIERISSGSLSLDVALGGGWPVNHWIEVVGHECLAPGTKILTTDLVWKNIEDLRLAEEIVGFDEDHNGLGKGRTSCYRRAEVTHLGSKVLPCYEITTPYGTTIASAGHQWLTHAYGPRAEDRAAGRGHSLQRTWRRTDQLKIGNRVASLGAPWETEESWEAGWLAGFFDGEGTVCRTTGRVSVNQVVGPTADNIGLMLEKFGFEVNVTNPRRSREHWQDQVNYRLAGRYQDMRFLGSIRPQRLLEKSHIAWEGKSTKSVHGSTVPILAIKYAGMRKVITIETSTGTLVADGLLSHNSSGKTMLVLKTIAINQANDPNWTVVWFAAEDFVDSYAEMLGCDLDRMIVVQENTMETVYEAAIEFLDSDSIDCIVIDSLPALVPIREEEGKMEDTQPGLGALLTGKFFRKAGSGMGRSVTEDERPIVGFVINQWRNKIGGYGDPRVTPGGLAKNFFYFMRVEVRRDEWIKNTKQEPIGQTLKIVNVKNKQSPPGRFAVIDAYFARGNGFQAGDWDIVKDIVATGLTYGLIERHGAYYSYDGNRWNGRTAMYKALRKDESLQDKLYDAVLNSTTVAEPELPPPPKKKAARRG
jgi:recombination protein RecA